MTKLRQKIMYFAPDVGGGAISVLRDLICCLDRTKYLPIVVFATGSDDPRAVRVCRTFDDLSVSYEFLGESGAAVYGGGSVTATPNRDVGAWLQRNLGEKVSASYATLRAIYRFIRRDWSKAKRLAALIKEQGVDLVHINGTGGAEVAMVATVIAKVPSVAHVHMFPKITAFHRLLGKRMDQFLYISTAVQKWCVAGGWSNGVLVHNGVDLDRFLPSVPDSRLRSTWLADVDRKAVGVVGRIVSWKGQHVFVKAIADVSKVRPDVTGVIIGEIGPGFRDKEYYQALKNQVKELGIEDKIHFVGEHTDMPTAVNSLDVVVHSSVQPEPFGLVIIEGMACAKPVVAVGEGGVTDIVTHQKDGLLVPPDSPGMMAEAIIAILADPDDAIRMGECARQVVESRFSLQHQIDKIQAVYADVLQARTNHEVARPVVAK